MVLGAAFAAAQPAPKAPEPGKQFQVTAKFSEAENTVEELTGTPVADPDSQAKLAQARAVFEEAVAQFPNTPLALNFLARTYAFPSQDRAMGITTFEKSLAIDANQPDTISRLVALCLDAGQRQKAGEVQAKYVDAKANPELATKVGGMIATWDGTEGRRMVSAGRTEEGLALIDKAMKETSDPVVRKTLQDMRDSASQEWEITQYNTALEKAKAADYKGAYAILEKLIPVAKTPEVLERAKRLAAKIEPAVHPKETW
jgi:tetratricopeptide (TPR) repeat protein